MRLRSKNLLSLPEDFGGNLRRNRMFTLLLIQATGEVSFANTVGEKELMIADFATTRDLLLLAWTGRWRTDIFLLTKADLEKYWYSDPLTKGAEDRVRSYRQAKEKGW